jgi:signal transduction histidine kinase
LHRTLAQTSTWTHALHSLGIGSVSALFVWIALSFPHSIVVSETSGLFWGAAVAATSLVVFFFLLSKERIHHAQVNRALDEGFQRISELEQKTTVLSKLNGDLEHALTERNHRINEVLEGMPGEALWVSRDARYVRVNSELALAEGMYPRDFEGRPVGFTGRELSKQIREKVQEFFAAQKQTYQAVLKVPLGAGSTGNHLVSIRKFRNGEDALVLVQSLAGASDAKSPMTDDLTAAWQKTDDRYLPQTLPSARLVSLGELVAGIAHEINNPLAIINGRVQVLRTKAVSGKLSNEDLLLSLEKLSQSVFRVSKIIAGLRSFVRPGTGEQPEEIAPLRAIEDALDFCRGRFHKQNIRLILEVTSTHFVKCVPVQLSQILLNLLNNSLHSLDSKPDKWVRIEASDAADHVEFRVIDCGQGVSREISERIFEPFFTTKEFSKGTGLGLSISRGLAESNGGTLVVDTRAQHTTFVLKLPSVPNSGEQVSRFETVIEQDDVNP